MVGKFVQDRLPCPTWKRFGWKDDGCHNAQVRNSLGVESQELIFVRGAEGRAEGRADRGADRGAERPRRGPIGGPRAEGRRKADGPILH